MATAKQHLTCRASEGRLPRRQYSFREFRVDMLGKVMTFGMILVAAVEAFMPGTVPESGMILVLLGFAMGYMNQIEDVGTRTAYYVLAFTLPTIADSMDMIPAVGGYLNGFMDGLAMTIAGAACMTVLLQVYKMAKEA